MLLSCISLEYTCSTIWNQSLLPVFPYLYSCSILLYLYSYLCSSIFTRPLNTGILGSWHTLYLSTTTNTSQYWTSNNMESNLPALDMSDCTSLAVAFLTQKLLSNIRSWDQKSRRHSVFFAANIFDKHEVWGAEQQTAWGNLAHSHLSLFCCTQIFDIYKHK